jgi:hypothetical protein
MAIPIYAVTQAGGKIYSMDDAATVNDFAAVDGTGGTAFSPYLLSTLFPLKRTLGYYDFRKFRQRVDAPSALTIAVTPWRDGTDTGQVISRMFPVSAVDVTNTPLWVPGSDFQVKVAFSGYTRPFEVGNASASFVPRRHSRGTGVGSNPALPMGTPGFFVYSGVGKYNGTEKYDSVLL